MKHLAVFPLAAFVLAGCQDTTQPGPEENPPTLFPSSQVSSLGVPDIIVTTTADVVDFGGAQQMIDLAGPDGLVSLREAIIASNNTPGQHVIGFDIPVEDEGFDETVFTIRPVTGLPSTADGLTIDGATQTAASGNTNTVGPEIVIDGSLAVLNTPGSAGLDLGPDNHVHSLVIHSFSPDPEDDAGPGIGSDRTGVRVTGCFLGTDHTGTVALPNGNGIEFSGSGHVIGGVNPGEGNLISGNIGTGINLGPNAYDIVVQGNLIGTDVTGSIAITGGGLSGVQLNPPTQRITIGGLTPEARNIISGHSAQAVWIPGGSNDEHRILGNFIGTDITGTAAVPNGGGIFERGTGNLIYRNVIAFNGDRGITIAATATGNLLSENSLFSNGDLGIDLASDGLTPNDPGDIDTGPNNLMNFPMLTEALATPGGLVVEGMIDTPNPETVTIEFFANPVPTPGGDASGHGEGAVFLATAEPDKKGRIKAILPRVEPGTLISATATDADGNTSEFAANIEATGPLGKPFLALEVAVGGTHACALGVDLRTYCWGDNTNGQLGDGSNTSSTRPVRVTTDLRFVQLTSGGSANGHADHTCGLTEKGEAYCWGRNEFGQLGDGMTTSSNVPVRAAGSLVFTDLDAGPYHTCGVTSTGQAYCWGANGPFDSNLGDRSGLGYALGAPTTEDCANPNPPYRGAFWPCSPTPLEVSGGIGFRSISAGLWATCGVTASGAAYCWGLNGFDNLGTGSDQYTTEPTLVAAGGLAFGEVVHGAGHSCGLVNRNAYCWGLFHPAFQWGATGTGTFGGSSTPTPVVGGLSFTTIVPSDANNIYAFTCGLTTDGDAYCWGANRRGQLGTDATDLSTCDFDGTSFSCSNVPVPVAGGLDFIALATGNAFACGVAQTRSVYCWGWNFAGQLGDGTTTNQFTPVRVQSPERRR
jgi:alpha-tubulin suppressor-like RCC1 family protein